MVDDLVTLLFLVLLQAVLGLDNLLYISLESKRAPIAEQQRIRRIGIGLAIFLRIGLLFALINVIDLVEQPLFAIPWEGVVTGSFNLEALIIMLGGGFILWTAVKEIWHMMNLAEHAANKANEKRKSGRAVLTAIIIMNVVFSFDSILSAMALTDTFWVMAVAIVIGGLMMMWLSDKVAAFLEKNRMFEVLGLFVLLIVGVMLLSEGAHKADLHLFGGEVTAMSKATFYLVIGVLVIIDIIQSRYQKQLTKAKVSIAPIEAQATQEPSA
ncbi:MAG: putative tellurium resistance membrane protein TerC [Myxococcota bacterium]